MAEAGASRRVRKEKYVVRLVEYLNEYKNILIVQVSVHSSDAHAAAAISEPPCLPITLRISCPDVHSYRSHSCLVQPVVS